MRDPFSIDWTKEPEVKKEPESASLEVDLTDYSCTTWSMVENEGYTKVFHDLKPNVENHKPLSWLNETTGGGMGPSSTSQENLDYARSEQYLIQQELMGIPYSVAHANQTVAIRLWEQRVKEELQEQLVKDLMLFGVSYEWQRKDDQGKVVASYRLDPLSVIESQEGYRHMYGCITNGYVTIPKDQVVKKFPPHPQDQSLSWLNELTGNGFGIPANHPPKDPCPHTQARAYKADGRVYVEVPMSLIGEAESMGLSKGWKHLKAHIDKALCGTYDHRLHATDSQCNESSLKLVNKVMLAISNSSKEAEGIRASIEEPDVIDAGISHGSGQLVSLPPGMTMSPLSSILGSFYEVYDVHAPDYQIPGTLT